jgi:site-specific DNA-methyltransferase (adenine-specific)
VEPVMKSIQKDGYRARIIVDKDGVIIAGHTRYEAMKRLGWTEAEVWIADDMTPEQIADYRIRDNLTADFATWDFSELEAEIAEMDLDFDMSEFDGNADNALPPIPENLDANTDYDEEAPLAIKLTFPNFTAYSMYEGELKGIAERMGAQFAIVKA